MECERQQGVCRAKVCGIATGWADSINTKAQPPDIMHGWIVPFRVRIYTITLPVYLNYLSRLQALTSKRTQRAVPLQGAQ